MARAPRLQTLGAISSRRASHSSAVAGRAPLRSGSSFDEPVGDVLVIEHLKTRGTKFVHADTVLTARHAVDDVSEGIHYSSLPSSIIRSCIAA